MQSTPIPVSLPLSATLSSINPTSTDRPCGKDASNPEDGKATDGRILEDMTMNDWANDRKGAACVAGSSKGQTHVRK